MDSALIRYHEIALKKGNRQYFTELLKRNLLAAVPAANSIYKDACRIVYAELKRTRPGQSISQNELGI